MSTSKTKDLWRFKISVDTAELINMIHQPASFMAGTVEDRLVKWGVALDYARKALEGTFQAAEDGRIEPCKCANEAATEVEIDFFALDNYGSLLKLNDLFVLLVNCAGEAEFQAAGFRVHGHVKDAAPIVYIGFDRNGLFLADKRRACEDSKLDAKLQR